MSNIEVSQLPLDVLPDPHLVIGLNAVVVAANAAFDRRLLADPRAIRLLAETPDERVELATDVDGDRRIYSAAWTPCTWQGEEARLVRLTDVTHDRLDSDRLRSNVQSLEEILDVLPASLVIVDGNGVIVSANARWHVSARVGGMALAEAGVGASYLDVCDRAAARGDVQAAAAAAAAAGLRDVLARRAMSFEMTYEMSGARPAATEWYRLVVNALQTHPGAVIQHYDITELQRQQQERLEVLALFKAVFDGALDGIVIYDDHMRLVAANQAGLALARIDAPASGRELADFVVPAEREALWAQHRHLLTFGESRGVFHLQGPGGTVTEVEYAARAHVVPGRHVAVVRDMTEARRLEGQLRQAQKMEALGQLTGGIAHDFNNLLTVIVAHSDLLLSDESLPADVREGLAQMLQASQRGADMVRKLMAFGRREQLRLEPTHLDRTLQDTAGILRRVLPETIEVHVEVASDVPPVAADATAVQQILLNLATNARDAMRDQGGVLRFTLTADREAGRTVRLAVSDTGCGMAADTMAHLFEPFFTTKPLGEGTGLGMAMVYGLMEQMGGHVTVASDVGAGTRVLLEFPAALTEASAHVVSSADAAAGRGGSEHILLVEDDNAIRSLTGRVLRRAGYTVTEAESGDDAARLLEDRADDADGGFDLIVSDIVMPHGDGARVLAAVHRFAPAARIVWVTGYAGDGYADSPVHAPCDAPIIQKPWTTREFLSRVRVVLDGPPNVPFDVIATHVPL